MLCLHANEFQISKGMGLIAEGTEGGGPQTPRTPAPDTPRSQIGEKEDDGGKITSTQLKERHFPKGGDPQ